ncbi:TPA: hypothetical protein BOS_17344 [Bos taurus]|nr:TPA: hypothetical protein BOS_17344 [Bos taurus]
MTPIPADAGAPPPAPGQPPAAPGEPGAEAQPPVITQTKEELLFYAPDYLCLTLVAVILFPPLGITALVFSVKDGLTKTLTSQISHHARKQQLDIP